MYRVCIADDESYVRKSIEDRVVRSGKAVEVVGCAQNGKEAALLYRTQKPDIFFVDINMSDVDGLSFIRQVREEDAASTCKFVIISGYDDFVYLQQAIRLGVMNYLKKPIQQEEFCNVLQELCELLDRERQEQFRLQQKSRFLIYQDFLAGYAKKLENGVFTTVMVYSNAECDLLSSTALDCLLNRLQTAGMEELYGVAFRGAPNVLMFVFPNTDTLKEAPQQLFLEFSTQMDGVAFYATSKKQLFPALMRKFDRQFNQRFFSSLPQIAPLVAEEPQSGEGYSLSAFESALERRHLQVCHSFLREKAQAFQTGVVCGRTLSSFYRDVILLLVNQYVKAQLQIPEGLKEELLLFALAKYKQVEEITAFLCAESRKLIGQMEEVLQSSELIDEVARYLKEHFRSEVSLNDLAEEFFVSPTYLSRRFKEKRLCTITQYVEGVRLKTAKDLLGNPMISVSEVAELVGYSDPNYFARVFKKNVGIAPTDYRKNCSENSE